MAEDMVLDKILVACEGFEGLTSVEQVDLRRFGYSTTSLKVVDQSEGRLSHSEDSRAV